MPIPLPAPFLVVIITTPSLAREPYKADAVAPFSTVIDSMSSGLIEENPSPPSELLTCPDLAPNPPPNPKVVLSIGTPFTIISGWFTLLKEDWPRILILVDPPGPVPMVEIFTPESFPCNVLIGFGVRFVATASAFTVAVAKPKRLASFLIPSAVTTTSLSTLGSEERTTSSVVFPLSLTSLSRYPTKEKIKLALPVTFRVKLPLASVIVPWVV